MQAIRLDRHLTRLQGSDAKKLVENLTTNMVAAPLSYHALLNPQGRFLFDAFCYAGTDIVLESSRPLTAHLRPYMMRSNVKIVPCEEEIYSIWNPTTTIGMHKDPRNIGMGYRAFFNQPPIGCSLLKASEYQIQRTLLGIAEGTDFLPKALPLEYNLELLRGVDFHKGCYLGQELTIRTHHTGVLRKRVVPIQIMTPGTPPVAIMRVHKGLDIQHPIKSALTINPENTFTFAQDADLLFNGKKAGKILSGIHNIGLGLIRLDYLSTIQDPIDLVAADGTVVRAYAPDWWPADIVLTSS